LIKKGVNARLTFVGVGPQEQNLKSKAGDLKLDDRVDFAGFIRNDRLRFYYRKCDLILAPGKNETFSAVPLEGLKYAKLSIISKDCGLKEVIPNYAIFVKSTVDDFYRKIVEFSRRKEFYIKKAKEGKRWVEENLGWDKYAKKFVSLIKTKEVDADFYNTKYFDIHHKNPNSIYLSRERQKRIETAINFLDLETSNIVLDLGCGNGEVSERIAPKVDRVIGIDYSGYAVKLAKNRRIKNAEFFKMDACSLKFPDNYFDRIVCLDVIEHISPIKLEIVFKEVKRVLKPGGVLVVETSPNSFYLSPFSFLAKKFLGIKSFEYEQYHLNIFNYFKFRNLFEDFGGIKKITLTNDGHFYFSSRIVKNKRIPKWIKFLAVIVDYFFENPVFEKIVLATFLKIFFAHDLWAVIRLNKIK